MFAGLARNRRLARVIQHRLLVLQQQALLSNTPGGKDSGSTAGVSALQSTSKADGKKDGKPETASKTSEANTPETTTESTTTTTTNTPSRFIIEPVCTRKRPTNKDLSKTATEFKKHQVATIKDRHGCPILSWNKPVDGRTINTRIPLLNASALLDKREYCLKSAKASTTKSGTDAARRLLRGQRDLVQVLRQQSSLQTFILQGHGIPTALLQDNLCMAFNLLTNYEAAALQWHQQNKVESIVSSESLSSLPWHEDWLETAPWSVLVRSKTDGAPTRLSARHQPVWSRETRISFQLYLAAMYRLTTQLSCILPGGLTPASYRIEFMRGLADSVDSHPTILVEWSQSAVNPDGQLGIRVQGYAGPRRPKGRSVTLCLDANFKRVPALSV
jgi:hypothetical protein